MPGKALIFTHKSASVCGDIISIMSLRSRSQGFRSTGFFRSYFVPGILILFAGFFLYFNWVTERWERETSEFSRMLAVFAGMLSSVTDKEASDAGKEIIDKFKFPFIVTKIDGEPLTARGIGDGLREKILNNALTQEERQKLKEIVSEMDGRHEPIRMKGVIEEEGRKIIGYVYYDQIEWSLNPTSAIVLTDVVDSPVFALNIGQTDQNVVVGDAEKEKAQSFVDDAKEKLHFNTIQSNPPYEKLLFHYGSSRLFYHLRWWLPLAQIAIVGVFLSIGFLAYQRIKHNEQQAIWAGLAKETAHQLGTPISSLMGWLEVLGDQVNEQDANTIYSDMRNDLRRLEDITARFGEVGSLPKRELLDIRETIHSAVIYFQKRLPHRRKYVEIIEDHQNIPKVEANEILLQWVIENLIKNSLDAIERDDGRIHIRTKFDPKKKDVIIIYKDNGKGIPRRNRKRIFSPGYSSKEHGWGLGLAIVKRVIESYHGGSVKVAEGGAVGATFEITLPAKMDEN